MNREIDPSQLTWIRQPAMYVLEPDRIVLETEPYTSFHSLSFDNTNAFGLTLPPANNFSFTARVDYRFRGVEDECGILLRLDNTHWAKAGIECRGSSLDLSCTVYADGYGDRSCREIGDGIRWMYFRVLYWNGNVRFQYSFNGERYTDMRWFHFGPGETPVSAGMYACSGADSSFDCTFSRMNIVEL
ncbi:MAG: DUF1349 domain-containing protein [Solobacterium sp.]|nr:DUF1349 domain-containing protein [Solobacterium sp.]